MRTITIPAFGTFMPEHGGHFSAIMRGPAADGSEDYVLFTPAADAPGAELEAIAWAGEPTSIEGADSLTDGKANTAAMAAAGLALGKHMQALELNGHTDWFLPAASEMRALQANIPELFNQDDAYWTSSQYSRDDAWVQDFEYGYSNYAHKGYTFRARAARRVQLQHFAT